MTERESTRDQLAAASLARPQRARSRPCHIPEPCRLRPRNLASSYHPLDQIKALRQTILNLAVRGKLVEQDPNDEPASELLKRIAAEKEAADESGEIGRKSSRRFQLTKGILGFPNGWSRSDGSLDEIERNSFQAVLRDLNGRSIYSQAGASLRPDTQCVLAAIGCALTNQVKPSLSTSRNRNLS